jgi:hypothetical protein
MSNAPTRRFHHVGLTAFEEQPDEDYIPSSRCWVTDPKKHPMRIEFLRYAPDSSISADFQGSPHIAYEVDELEPHLEGKEVEIPPFDVDDPPFARVAFTKEDGVFVEYMKFYPGRSWFNGK